MVSNDINKHIDDIEKGLDKNINMLRNNIILCIFLVLGIFIQLSILSYNLYNMDIPVNTTVVCDCKSYMDDIVNHLADTTKHVYNTPVKSMLDSSLRAFY